MVLRRKQKKNYGNLKGKQARQFINNLPFNQFIQPKKKKNKKQMHTQKIRQMGCGIGLTK